MAQLLFPDLGCQPRSQASTAGRTYLRRPRYRTSEGTSAGHYRSASLSPCSCATPKLTGLASSRPSKPAFKNKGMQLGSKGAKKQADLLETLGGAPVPEECAPLMMVRL